MTRSFRFWCFVAAALSLATTAAHIWGGGPEFHLPALNSALPLYWKAAFSTIWHEITALLLLNGLALICAAIALRKNTLLLGLILLLNVSFTGLFFGYGLARLGTAFELLQWVAFLLISATVALAMKCNDNLLCVTETSPTPEHFQALPRASFADTYVVQGAIYEKAIDAAQEAFGHSPKWISKLMQLRNALVAPFGLIHEASPQFQKRVGIFPILQDTPSQVVLGLDDKHLDFRIVVDFKKTGGVLSMTTLVQPHNVFGKVYLAIIMPFHRLIAATILAQAVKT